MSERTVASELRTAITRVNAAFSRLPESERPEVPWDGWDDVLDRALLAGDEEKSLAAIRAWRDHHLEAFERVKVA